MQSRLKKIFLVLIFLFLTAVFFSFSLAFFCDTDSQQTRTTYNKNLALGRPVSVSSSPDKAHILVDGQERPNVSWHTSWSPPQIPSRPSWISIDLGQTQLVERLIIVFSVAAYEGIYDIWAPPHSIVIEMGDSLDKMQPIEFISSTKIPENGDHPDKRRLEVRLKSIKHARYVKLVFPTGGKLPSMPDIIGLGEVAVYGPAQPPQKHENISLEGHFGKIELDINAPQIVNFFVREQNGQLSQKNLLAGPPQGLTFEEDKNKKIFYRQGGYTYISDKKGHRFESRHSRSHKVETLTDQTGKIKKITLVGIKLQSEAGLLGPVEEDWTLEETISGALSWTITQQWKEPFNVDISGTPALYLARFGGWGAYRDRRVNLDDPQITSTIWYEPAHLYSGTHPDYKTDDTNIATEYRTHTIDVRDTWAIYKLFTNFHLTSDLCLKVKGGYLFRRAGVRNDFNEIGATTECKHDFQRQRGDHSTIVLTLSAEDKFATGQQLAIEIPDHTLAKSLRDLHASVLNGGVISDSKRYNFGNGTEDANYAGSADFQARALSVSTERGALSESSYNADDAFKGHLEQILATVNEQGLTCFGFNAECKLIDDNLHVISAAKTYAIKTGNREFINCYYPTFEKMISFFITNLDKSNGLFRSPHEGAHWYYDGISFSGFNTYYQAFLYQALMDLAQMSEIIGKTKKATSYRNQAKRLAININTFLWLPDAPGGPRYADWIDESGKSSIYFIDIAQYPLIALGIAPPERAEAVLATADKRLTELKKQYGHSRKASLSMLWPLSPQRGERCFGSYFYGGSLLASTYWEVLARARAGHVDGEWGAYRLLQNFAKHFAETSFVGSNSIDIRGNISLGGDEGYLSDMVVVPSALVHGLLGINLDWDKIHVIPKMPSGWKHAKASLIWKGHLYNITINENRTNIVPR